MNAIELCDQSDRMKWLRMRMAHIGASDVPRILGLSRFGSAATVYVDKTGDPDFLDDTPPSDSAELGHFLESFALRKLAEDYSAAGYERDGRMFKSRERPHMAATRDGVLEMADGTEKSAEVKTTAYPWEDGEVPPYIYAQLQAQCYVWEEPEIILGVIFRIDGSRALKAVPRDEGFIRDTMLPACDEFWDKVERRDPSGLEVDGSEWTRRALEQIHRVEPGHEVILDAAASDKVDELVAIRDEARALEARKGEVTNWLRQAIGSAEIAHLSGGEYMLYKETLRKAYTVEAKTIRTLRGPYGGRK